MKNYIEKYLKVSFLYAILAMVGGVFYREFTKFNGFNGKTTLSIVHTHYFILGMFMFLILLLIEKNFNISDDKLIKKTVFYQIGLNITVLAFLMRGICQTLEMNIPKGFDAGISGIAGIGHILIGVSLFLILIDIRKKIIASDDLIKES